MVKQTGIHAEGVNQLLRTMNRMGSGLNDDVRFASVDLAEKFLSLLRSSPMTETEAAAANVFKVYRDRVPKVGFPAGTRVAVSGRPKIGEFFFGTEFGGGNRPTTRQFRSHQNTYWGGMGYFFYPVLTGHGRDLAEKWFDVVVNRMDDDWDRAAARSAG